MSSKQKKKSKKTHGFKPQNKSTGGGQMLMQFSENENGDKTTTDAESFRKNMPKATLSPTIMSFKSIDGSDVETLQMKKRTNKNNVPTIMDDDDFDVSLSMSDNDIDYGAEEAKDTVLKAPEKQVVISKIKEKPVKSDDILPSKPKSIMKPNNNNQPQQKPAQGKKTSFQTPKKKAGGEMKMKMFSTQDQAGTVSMVQHQSLKESLSDIGSVVSTQPSFYNDEKIHDIYTFLNDIVTYIKTNPFYVFAAAVATAASKKETYFIRNTVQDLINVITGNGRLNAISNDYNKRFITYSETLKNVNHILKSSSLSPTSIASSSTSDISDLTSERSANITAAELALRESLRRMKMIQEEMDTIKKLIINGNSFISSKFYYSQDLISLVNTIITEVQLLPNDDGFVSPRRYSPDKIIVFKEMIRTKLAEVCAMKFSTYSMMNASRPTARYLQTNLNRLYNENMLKLKEMLDVDDDVLDDEISPLSLPFQSFLAFPESFLTSSSSSPPETPPVTPFIPTPPIITSQPISQPPTSPFSSPIIGATTLNSPVGLFSISPLSSQRSAGKKRAIFATTKSFHVPKRFRI